MAAAQVPPPSVYRKRRLQDQGPGLERIYLLVLGVLSLTSTYHAETDQMLMSAFAQPYITRHDLRAWTGPIPS